MIRWDQANRSVTDDPPTDAEVAMYLGNGHPKCKPPLTHLPPQERIPPIEQGAAQPETGIGVGGAMPIGAFQS